MKQNLKIYILFPLTLLIVVSVSIFFYGIYVEEKLRTENESLRLKNTVQKIHKVLIHEESEKLSVALAVIKDNARLQQVYLTQDRASLYKYAQPILQKIAKVSPVTHFYFHNADGINFLRVHQPDRYGDRIKRYTLLDAMKSKQRQAGIELGPLGTFTLRVVEPWYQGKRLLGYLELGEEISHLLASSREVSGMSFALTIKKQFIDRKVWENSSNFLHNSSFWDQLPDSVIVHKTLKSFPDLLLAEPGLSGISHIQVDDQFYQIIKMPVQDAGLRQVGQMFYFFNITERLSRRQRNQAVIFIWVVSAGILVFILFYCLTGRAEKTIRASYLRLVEESKCREEEQKRHVNELEKEVSARQQVENQLQQNNASLEHLLMASPAVIYTSNVSGDYALTFISQNVEKLLDYQPDEFINDPSFWLNHIHEEDKPRVLAELLNAFEKEKVSHEYRILAKDGRYHWLYDCMRIERDRQGKSKEIVGFWVDITEQKQMESIYKDTQQLLSLHFEHTPIAIIEWNTDFEIMAWNPAAENIFAYSKTQVIGKKLDELFCPDNKQQVFQSLQQLLIDNEQHWANQQNLTRQGEVVICDWYSTVLRDVGNNIIGAVSLVEDFTERKIIEASSLKANRALKMLLECNGALVRATDIDCLLESICQILVDRGDYLMTWVGFVDTHSTKNVVVAARAGRHDFIPEPAINLEDDSFSHCSVIKAIQTGRTRLTNEISEKNGCSICLKSSLPLGCNTCLSVPLKDDQRVIGTITVYTADVDTYNVQELEVLEDLAGDIAYGVHALKNLTERNHATQALTTALMETVEAIARTVEKRDPYTAGHQDRVAQLAVAIAEQMGLSSEQIEGLQLGASIHDIGKIYIPSEILNRPGSLTEHEFGMIQSHPQVGFEIMEGVSFPWPVKEMILQHHECIDGSGYPHGLKGHEIILEAKIIAVADAVEAITSHRPYRPSLGVHKALNVINQQAGIHYDRRIVEICISLFEEHGFEWST